MKKMLLIVLSMCAQRFIYAQNDINVAVDTISLPFKEIPAYPDSFSAENVVARMIDGLGFRYYWATEGLRPEDLAFRPTPEARSSEETIDHILGLSNIVLNGLKYQPNVRSGEETSPLTFEVKRRLTLEKLQEASKLLKQSDRGLEQYKIIFQNGAKTTEFPFWNMLNGPIADALWHVGQIVSFRRSSGNPFNAKVSVFSGTLRQ
ncbi:MAG: hypothetical protein ACKVT2_08370 [Saprospiraceae bacterium]